DKFRKMYDIAQNESINAPGFWFEDDTFYLPETFGISNETITLHYNPYEIAAYATGPVEINLPLSTFADQLKYDIE
ncbi:MAG: RsiV family protein, partial [Marinirhabdus sp.]|nr:RsiV family protein [Marinirhabdus sp.]